MAQQAAQRADNAEVVGSSPAGGTNDKFIVSFRANVVLTAETKTGMSSEADLNVNHGE